MIKTWKQIQKEKNFNRFIPKSLEQELNTSFWKTVKWLIVIFAALFGSLLIILASLEPQIEFNPLNRVEAGEITPNNQEKEGVEGIASWYDYEINGIEWSKDHDTCASRDFKRYSYARVVADNGNEVVCFVNDYGPEEWTGRIIDLSSHAFKQLDSLSKGLVNAKVYEEK